MERPEDYLADTNLLLRSASEGHPMQEQAIQSIATLRQQGARVWITPQNLVEFWAVATRPGERNGLGLTVEAANAELLRLTNLFPLLPDAPEIYIEWHRLVVEERVLGLQVYDARLVAVMRVYGVTHLLTFNVDDFRRYPGITVVHPQDVSPTPGPP